MPRVSEQARPRRLTWKASSRSSLPPPGDSRARCAGWISTASRAREPKCTAWRMGFRRAISCEPLSPPERRREPTEGRLPSERVAPSPFKGKSKIFTIASVPLCTDAMDIVTRKERRHFLPPSEGRRVPVPQFLWEYCHEHSNDQSNHRKGVGNI